MNAISYIRRDYVLLSLSGAVVFISAFLIYLPTLYNAPVWDDLFVINNYVLIDKNNPYSFLFNSNLYYRPLVNISMSLDHSLWETNPFGYHMSNCIIHSANALLLFLVFFYFLKGTGAGELNKYGSSLSSMTGDVVDTLQPTGQGIGNKGLFLLPIVSSLIFASHPINTEAVAWISGRTDMLATTFFLLAFLSFMAYERDGQGRALSLSAIFFFFSLLSKENGIAFIAVAFFYALAKGMNRKSTVISISVLSTVILLYFVLRKGAGLRDVLLKPGSKGAFLTSNITIGDFVHTFVYGCAFYIEKIVLPIKLTLMPKIPASPIYITVFLLPFISGLVLFLRRLNVELFYLLWIGGTLLPSLTIMFSQVANPLGERYLYLPSAGFACLVGLIGCKLFRYRVFITVAVVFLLAFSYLTHDRLKVWKNDLTLWQDTVRKNPDSVVAHTNYAIALLQEKNIKAAEDELTIALKNPVKSLEQTSIILNTIATIHMKRDNYVTAEELLNASIMADQANLSAHNNLGYLYMRMSEVKKEDKQALLTKAISIFEKALNLSPGLTHTRLNLGLCYLELNKLDKAEAAFSAVIEFDPGGELSKKAIYFLVLTRMRIAEGLKKGA
ncbi:MAG: tetratricopeptide repeat protein [Nitrospirae bacterium]|nr:tetratricopeptide repeat protein [Nitrospirota bacterium]